MTQRILTCLILTSTMVGCANDARVAETGQPAAEVGKIDSAEDLRLKMSSSDVVVIHALDEENFRKAHIPGARNIDYEQMKPEMLPPNKAQTLIFYCAGPGCPVSGMAAKKATSWGYSDVWVYKGGIRGWKTAGMEVSTSD